MAKSSEKKGTVSPANTVLVIGGGASGMMAAITATRCGASVTLLEQNEKNGKKICATGNGRCNFTNSYWDDQVLRGTHPEFAADAMRQFTVEDTIRFFHELGIEPIEKNGYYYPRSNQAAAVSELLELELRALGVKMKTKERAVSIGKQGKLWSVKTEGWHYEAGQVILAMGSSASAIKGCDGMGYELAGKLGHKIVKPLPALTGLKLEEKDIRFQKWSGVRTEGKITILVDGKKAAEASGELQLTDYGVSGIPAFQVSRYAVRALDERKRVQALLDFYPGCSDAEFADMLMARRQRHPGFTEEQLLLGLYPEKLARVLTLTSKTFLFTVKESMPMNQAQVACGGVATDQINPETMESRICPGIYFTGELLDIDGTCGGYNLQWAWSSGYTAGKHAAERAVRR